MLYKTFFCKNWGGATMLLLSIILTFISTNILAQSTCPIDRFEFEIEKVPPAPLWKVNSTSVTPGAFHAFYRVKLKTKAGQPPFPDTFTFNHLRFDGIINVNNFTSRINNVLTSTYTPVKYGQYLTYSQNGEIVWEVGSASNCEPGGGGVGVKLPLGTGLTSITLFTIVIEAVPGDLLKWNTLSAFVEQCSPTSTCQGSMFVSTGGSTNILFPAPYPPNRRLIYEYAYDAGLLQPFVRVAIAPPLAPSGHFAKVDASIHIVPEMATDNLDLVPSNISGGPTLTRAERRKNADGSFDIYFSFEDFPHPDSLGFDPSDTLYVLAIQLNGIYNLSQGGTLKCSLNTGRCVSDALVNNNSTSQLMSALTVIDIPGHEPCENNFKITGSTYDTIDCKGVVRFTLNHDHPTAMSLQLLKLEFLYTPNGAGNAIPDAPFSDLPDAANSGSLSAGPNNSFWIYSYEKQGTFNNPLMIENGMYVDVPFDIQNNCVQYRVTIGEADPTPGAGNGNSYCALEVELAEALCDPEVVGSVFLSNFATAPYYRVKLKDFNSPYDLEETTFCEPAFSFCPDQSQAPFFLQVETNPAYEDDYLCVNAENTGVTTYDLVLIDKHLKGIQPFTSVYQRFAANADGNGSIESLDIKNFRRLILGISGPNDLPFSITPSWWYIRESLIIPTPPDRQEVPFGGVLANTDTCHVPINGIGNYGQFYAVKLGDVNFTCNCNNLRPNTEDDAVKFRISGSEVRKEAEVIYVPIYADAPFDLVAAQMGIRFDPSLLSFSEVLPNPELPIYPYHFGLSKTALGEIRFAWSLDHDLTSLPAKKLLFTLKFEMKPGARLPEGPLCWVSDNIMKSLAYPEAGTEHPVRLVWESNGQDRLPVIGLVVNPNPFEESVTAFIYTEKPMKATVQLAGNRGTIYAQLRVELQAGDNAVPIEFPVSAQPGVYFLTLVADGQRIQRRIVKI